jgi:kinesin family member 13
LESLPPDQLANFYGAGGGLQISGSSPVAAVTNTKGDKVQYEVQNDQEDAESEHEYVNTYSKKRDVEMKVVHFDPNTVKGQQVAEKYVQDGAKQVEPVALNDHKYNRYLPLKVSGAHFPLPDVPELLGRKVTSVVVLAPVNNDSNNDKDSGRAERAAPSKGKTINFVAGDALKRLVKTPTSENYKKWLEIEKNTTPDLQSVVLLVTG